MKKKGHLVSGGLLAFAILFILGGCGQNESPVGPTGSLNDEASIRALVEDNFELFSYDYQDGSEEVAMSGEDAALSKELEGIEPVAFWREITDRVKEIDIHIYKDSLGAHAEVTITTELHGWFHTVSMDSHYTKEIDDTAVRYAYLERPADERGEARHGGWELRAVSGWEVVSDPCTRTIYSVQVTSSSGAVDTTITEVSSLWDLEDLFVLEPGDSVTLTVDTGDPEDLVFLHAPHFFRRPFQHIGGGIFQGTWVTADGPDVPARPRHATIDVIDHGAVFDDALPYDSRAWGMVYFVGEGPATN
jgi:hypothetical protein